MIDYVPLPKQQQFHNSPAKYKALVGGFGSGKTAAGCAEAIELSLRYPGNEGWICRRTGTELEDSTMSTFFEMLPESYIRSFNKTKRNLVLYNGSRVKFRTLDDPDKIRGPNLGFFYIDEASEVREIFFRKLMGRLRLATALYRPGFITTNPPYKDHWIYKLFVEQESTKYQIITAPSAENPYLPPDYVQELRESYPADWVKVFLDGEFGFLPEGRPVYPEFRPSLHVRKLDVIPGIPITRGWDFGYHHPVCVFTQKLGDRMHVLGELEGQEEKIDDFAKRVLATCAKRFPEVRQYVDWCDPAGQQHNDKSDRTSFQIMTTLGIVPRAKPRAITDGILINRILLQPRETTVSTTICPDTGQELYETDITPGMLVDPSAIKLIEGFSGGYHYPEKMQPDEKKLPRKDNIFDHLQDAIRYITCNQPDFRVWIKPGYKEPGPSGTVKFWKNANSNMKKGVSFRV